VAAGLESLRDHGVDAGIGGSLGLFDGADLDHYFDPVAVRRLDIWRRIAPEQDHCSDSQRTCRRHHVGQQFPIAFFALADDDIDPDRPVGQLARVRNPPFDFADRHSANAEDSKATGVGYG